MAGQADCERNMKRGRRWFTGRRARNIVLADDIFSEAARTNGVAVGVAGTKGGIQERPAAFPAVSAAIEDMFSADDKVVARLVWSGTHTGSNAGIKAAGTRVRVPGFAICRSKTATWLDLNDTGSVRSAKAGRISSRRRLRGVAGPGWAGLAKGARLPAPAPEELPAPAPEEPPAPAPDEVGPATVMPSAAARLTRRMSPIDRVRAVMR